MCPGKCYLDCEKDYPPTKIERNCLNARKRLYEQCLEYNNNDSCFEEADRIAWALCRTYTHSNNEDGPLLELGKSGVDYFCRKWGWRGDDRVKGYLCWEWAHGFNNAVNNCSLKNFNCKIGGASCRDGREHYWVEICYNKKGCKPFYFDDGFWNGFLFHDKPPSGGKYIYPGYIEIHPPEECDIPAGGMGW